MERGRRNSRKRIPVLAAAMAVLSLVGCSESLPTYRYKLIVEIETPEGPRTGSSVIEVRTSAGSGFPGTEAGGIASSVRGEAVAVDLGRRGTLYALLSSRDEADRAAGIAPTALLPELVDKRGTAEAWGNNLRALKQRAERAELPASYYPLLIRFPDADDPSTVQEVDPENLSDSFGQGVRLKAIGVQLTDEPVTFGIQRRFSWWERYEDTHLDGVRLHNSNTLANNLNVYDFQRRD